MYFESTQHDINFQLDHKTKSYLFMSLKGKYYDMVSIGFNRSRRVQQHLNFNKYFIWNVKSYEKLVAIENNDNWKHKH